MAAKKTARNLRQQEPSLGNRTDKSAVTPHYKCKRTLTPRPIPRNGNSDYLLPCGVGEPPIIFRLRGRLQWALERLIAAEHIGCTPINEPGPRWAAYVHDLRKLGVCIETITERHSGAFPGTHARYVLRSKVREGH